MTISGLVLLVKFHSSPNCALSGHIKGEVLREDRDRSGWSGTLPAVASRSISKPRSSLGLPSDSSHQLG